jgi:hypothetical protein
MNWSDAVSLKRPRLSQRRCRAGMAVRSQRKSTTAGARLAGYAPRAWGRMLSCEIEGARRSSTVSATFHSARS